MTRVGVALEIGWRALLKTGRLRCTAQRGIDLRLRIERTMRGGMEHDAVLINAHVNMRGRRYLLPTQTPLSSASPEECEALVLQMIKRLRRVAKNHSDEELKIEECK